jgi:hypothetical protein
MNEDLRYLHGRLVSHAHARADLKTGEGCKALLYMRVALMFPDVKEVKGGEGRKSGGGMRNNDPHHKIVGKMGSN